MFTLLQDNEKRTPLHAAAYLGDAEIIELLILSGVCVCFLKGKRHVNRPLKLNTNTSLKDMDLAAGRSVWVAWFLMTLASIET